MKKKWAPYTAENHSAETPFRIRSKDGATTEAVFNQFGQLLNASDRSLITQKPDEMEVPDEKPEPAPKPPVP
jgi:hypothetical protein